MKKLFSLSSMILALVLVISSFPTAMAQSDFNYDNSVWVTLQAEQTYTVEELSSLLQVDGCFIVDKQTKEGKITYQLVVKNQEESVEQLIERIKGLNGVTQAGRNVFAGDYSDKESYLTLNQTVVEIPVGGTATLKITDAHLVPGSGYGMVGTMVEVDHELLPYEEFYTMVTGLGMANDDGFEDVFPIALYADDEERGADGLYLCIGDGDWSELLSHSSHTAEERLQTQSPVGKYVIASHIGLYYDLTEKMAQKDAVIAARIVYEPVFSGIQPHEEWRVENYEIAAVAVENGDENNQFYTATVVGKQVGETVVTVQHGGGSQITYATCTVKVVENTTTQTDVVWGDVNNDTKVDAKDALQVLKYAVQKAEFTPLQMLAAEVTGDQKIDAKDALEILKYSVGKIEQFPIEKGSQTNVTSTDVTPTNQ